MSSAPHPKPSAVDSDSVSEQELAVLARCYAFILRFGEERRAADEDGSEDAKKEINDEFRATPRIPR